MDRPKKLTEVLLDDCINYEEDVQDNLTFEDLGMHVFLDPNLIHIKEKDNES